MKVFITRPIPDRHLSKLSEAGIEVDVYEKDEFCPKETLLQRVKGVDGVIVQWEDYINEEFFNAAGDNLKIVATLAVGVGRIDLQAAKKRNIIVTNSPTPELSANVAESAVAMLLAVAKKTITYHLSVLDSKPIEYSPIGIDGLDVRNKATGIIGLGNIGSKIAKIMNKGFDNKILYFNKSSKGNIEERLKAKKVSLKELFKKSDFIFLALPEDNGTKGLVDKRLFGLMSPKSVFVSTSGDTIFDERALVKLVKERKIYGAALDIYSEDLKPSKDVNLVLTYHMANNEAKVSQEMAKICFENVYAVLKNGKAINPVN